MSRRIRHLAWSLGSGSTGAKVVLHAPALRGYADADPVGTWSDVSGNANDATAAGAARPTYKTAIKGGMPIVRFDGTTDSMATAAFSSPIAQPATIIVVANRTGGAGVYADVVDGIASSDRMAIAYDLTDHLVTYSGVSVASGNVVSGFNCISALFNGASSSVHVNGVIDLGLSANTGSDDLTGLLLSDAPSPFTGTQRFGGDVGSVFIFAADLGAALRKRIQQALGFTFRIATK